MTLDTAFQNERNKRVQNERQRRWRENNPERHKETRSRLDKLQREKVQLDRPFIAYDGEGITLDNGKHIYTLFACSDGRYVENYDTGLTGAECFELLLEGKRLHPTGIHVIYGGTYDMNMMIQDAPHGKIANLWEFGQTRWDDYFIRYRHRKEYSIKKDTTNVTLYDVQTFFQKSFVKACDEYLGDWPERELVMKGKENRAVFSEDDRETTREYCFAELAVLTRLMEELRRRLFRVGLRPSRWNGPGAIATSLFRRENIKAHLEPTNKSRLDATRRAYFGGRFELAKVGHYEGKVYEYDINSAYPAAMRYLPSLAGGSWHLDKSGNKIQSNFSLVHLQYSVGRSETREDWLLGPAPSRDKKGSIAFPSSGSVWLWEIEAKGVRDWCDRTGGKWEVKEVWSFTPITDKLPFGFLEPLYEQRKALKAAGDGAHVGIKLAINSLYGKTAQQVGWKKGRNGIKLPPYHQLDYAGFITASCRAQIWQAYMQNPEAIIAIETDAIFSMVPLDLDLGTKLGQWEETQFEDITYVQSGTYWATESNGNLVNKYRGFDRGTITRQMILDTWNTFEWDEGVVGHETRFGTMGDAVHRDAWESFCKWETNPRNLATELDGKRSHIGPRCPLCIKEGFNRFSLGVLHPTYCLRDYTPIESEPCSIEWLDESEYVDKAALFRRTRRDFEMGM
jgi:hypothetical protein